MASPVNEITSPKVVTASGALVAAGGALCGFMPTTSGTIQLGTTNGGSDILLATPVTAGQWVPLPFACPQGAFVTLAGGATGTFGVI
jgi:hypothetical protein